MLLIALALATTGSLHANDKIIYGDDNRLDLYQVLNPEVALLARSTAAMISLADLRAPKKKPGAGNTILVSGPSLASQGICSSERFAKQPTAAFCSGFLVSETLLVTAGHCVQTESDCADLQWAFDYKIDAAAQTSVSLKKSNIYGCKKIVEQVNDDQTQNDYAVIELDRPVLDRAPLKFRREGKIEVGTPLIVIGHPSGLPTKVADGAAVRALESTFFVGNLDTYGGNSGSAVFNAMTLEVEGILVRGDQDYVAGPGNCRVSNVVSNDGGSGEDVTYITNISVLKSLAP